MPLCGLANASRGAGNTTDGAHRVLGDVGAGERTIFVGTPKDDWLRAAQACIDATTAALEFIKPGVTSHEPGRRNQFSGRTTPKVRETPGEASACHQPQHTGAYTIARQGARANVSIPTTLAEHPKAVALS